MREKYESLPLSTLKDLAKARGLKGISTMKKAELVERMLEEDEKEKHRAGQHAPVAHRRACCRQLPGLGPAGGYHVCRDEPVQLSEPVPARQAIHAQYRFDGSGPGHARSAGDGYSGHKPAPDGYPECPPGHE